jgi:cytochrome P450 family 110
MLDTLPAGPAGKLRTTYRILRDPMGSLPAWHRRFGDPFTLPTVNGTVVMTGDPKLVKEIFAASPSTFAPFATQGIGPTIGEGSLLALHEPRHMRERKLLMPPFHGERMRAYAEGMASVAAQQLASAAQSPRFAALELAQSISLEVIVRAIFGAQDDARAKVLADAVLGLVEHTSPLLFFMPFLHREFGGFGPWARFRRHFEVLDRLLQEQIEQARAHGDGVDICSLLVQARYEDGAPMADGDIRDELRTLLFAGHETTAITIAWVLDHVHRNPEVIARLRDELDALGPDPEPADYARQPYLEAVCKEAMRIHPVVTEVLRVLVTPFRLGELDLPAGVAVSAGVLLVHRREDLYPEPLRFRPERFLERKFTPYEYLPFGGGHRRCIGATFASFEMAVVLGTALARFDFELLDERAPKPVRRAVTMAPSGGVPLRARSRR